MAISSSPQTDASLLSLMSWQWIEPLIRLARQRSLCIQDLYPLLEEERAEHCARRWKRCLKGSSSLTKALLWFDGTNLACVVLIVRMLWLAFSIMQVYNVKALIAVIHSRQPLPLWWGTVLASGMFVLPCLQTMAQNYMSITTERLGIKLRAAITVAMLNKIMEMKAVGFNNTNTGELFNIISNDTQKLMDFLNALQYVSTLLLDIAVVGILAWRELGIPALLGIIIMALAQLLQVKLGQAIKQTRKNALAFLDARVQLLTDVLSGIRVIKYNGWTQPFLDRIDATRSQELGWIRRASFLRALSFPIKFGVRPLACLAVFGVYTAMHNGELSPAVVFTMVSFFGVLQRATIPAAEGLLVFGEAVMALSRVQRILRLPNGDEENSPTEHLVDENVAVQATNCTMSWSIFGDEDDEPVLQHINFIVRPGEMVAITGPVGSGKTSFLTGLLGELKVSEGSIYVAGQIAYAPQQPWIFNDTVRNNIVFGCKFESDRYNAVVSACCLEQDIARLASGSDTEIGDRGINLSGGQKARISLARACYSSARIVFLDDPLAAVDVPTATHLIQHVFCKYLKGRTVVIVTHNSSCSRICDRVYAMESGTLSQIKYCDDEKPVEQLPVQPQDPRPPVLVKSSSKKDNKAVQGLTKLETMDNSRGLSIPDVKQYVLQTIGWPMLSLSMSSFLLTQAALVAGDLWLRDWADRTYKLSSGGYILVYGCLITAFFMLSVTRVSFILATLDAAKKMHRKMCEKVLRSPAAFFDQNPTGRILNRFTKDQAVVDEALPRSAQQMLSNASIALGAIFLVGLLLPWFLFLVPLYVFTFAYLRQFYVSVCCDLKRLDAITRSTVYAHFVTTTQGAMCIRAYGAQHRFRDKLVEVVDRNHQASMLYAHLSRWFTFRLEMTVAISMTVATILVLWLRNSISAGAAGVILVQSFRLTSGFQIAIKTSGDTENQFTSVERIQEYMQLQTEEDDGLEVDEQVAPADWPKEGCIEFVNYTLAYREDLPPALSNISFKVEAREKLGILGRTGSGKSSLVAALFRIIDNSACCGRIFIDRIDIKRVSLDILRRRISIIPQDPVLFRGSIRFNLDPFEEFSDHQIYEVLRTVHLSGKAACISKGLDGEVEDNGENFSLGERQLMCLARALLRRSCIVVLDEATAAVDDMTDQMIQATLRKVFQGCTILTIAHRIHTVIDYDRILILDGGGRIVEFDSPANLLRGGVFASMVTQCGEELRRTTQQCSS